MTDALMPPEWIRWLQTLKDRVEQTPALDAASITSGVFSVDQIPPLPWSKILKAGSSLNDLETRNAGDLLIGTLRAARMPALTGAVTSTVGTVATSAAGKFIVQGTADATLTAAQFLGALATGLLKSTATTGVLSRAVPATDYVAPSAYASANGLTVATARLLGRTTAATGAAEEISIAGGLTLSAGVLTGTASGPSTAQVLARVYLGT
jgi:hypothetical protein